MMPYLRLPGFLDADTHEHLLAWALSNEAQFVPAKLTGGRIDPSVRTSLSLRDLGPWQASLEARIAAAVPEWIETLKVTRFDLSRIELELSAYNNGCHFAKHIDTYAVNRGLDGDRMLSAVYYFHREPRAFEGGNLRLHAIGPGPDLATVDVLPEQNSPVVFPSWGPHEVLPVNCASGAFTDSRFAVNYWVYRANG